jgi:GNAT superfamily N-acetyltransferase
MEDPYLKTPRLAVQDVIENNHLWVFPTEQGFGSIDVDLSKHPMLRPTGVTVDGRKLVANDVFRIVHDYFGHLKDGNGFRAGGEENAWRSHSAMYSPLARGAMTTETRGQNSWLNYGPHGEKNRTAKSADTVYAAQKAGLMPQWVVEEGRADVGKKTLRQGGNFDAAEVARSKPDGVVGGTDGVSIIKRGDELIAEIDGKKVGSMSLSWRGPYATSVEVGQAARRKGIATQLYDAAEEIIGRRMIPSPLGMTDDAVRLWKRRLSVLDPAEKQALLREVVDIADGAGVGKSARERMAKLGFEDDPNITRQTGLADADAPRGQIEMTPGKAEITLFTKSDASTFMHESSHLWLEELIRDAARADAPDSLKGDLAAVYKWLGVKEGEELSTFHHEKWAKGFERYLAEGVAPNSALVEAFEKFKNWMIEVYRSLTEVGAPIPDEIKLVMGRMLGSEHDTMPGLTRGAPQSAGAAAVQGTTLEQNSIAGRLASLSAAATAKLNPLLRMMNSPSPVLREIATKLVESAVYLKKNLDMIATETSVETLMKEWNGGLVKAIKATDEAFYNYAKAGGTLRKREFREAVGRAMRNGDVDENGIAEVSAVARAWRQNVFEPLKEAAIAAKLLPKDVSVETALSYFSRMWNRNKLIAKETDFKNIVRNWVNQQVPHWMEAFDTETVAKAAKITDAEKRKEYMIERRLEREARFDDLDDAGANIADEVWNKLTGKDGEEGVRPEFITIEARGPLAARTFNIPDKMIEEFLESDVDVVGRRYTRIMGADVEVASKFGDVNMTEQFKQITADYAKLREGVTDERVRKQLDASETRDKEDLQGTLELLRGTAIERTMRERNYGRITRAFMHINYIRSMGEVILASLSDALRPAMVHGLSEYMATVGQLMANMKAIKMSVEEAQLAGNIAERVLAHRLSHITDIMDPYASRGPVEAFFENTTNVASKWNGIRMWTDMMGSVASVMTQNRILRGVANYATLKPDEKAYLAFLGIDEGMASRIAQKMAMHGRVEDGVRIANTEGWIRADGSEAEKAFDRVTQRTFRAAINKDVDSIIVKKGVADIPLLANTNTGRAFLQFKSFMLASNQRILLRGLQESHSRFIGGVIAMTAMGMFITYLKGVSGNRTGKQLDFMSNPGWWIGEGLDRSGIFAIPMEIANTFEKITGFNMIKSPIKAGDQGALGSQKAQNRSEVGAFLGPTAGLADDALSAAAIPRQIIKGKEVTQGQKNSLERLMPFNSYLGLRQLIRYVINPQAGQ